MKFPALFKFVLRRDITSGEQTVFVEELKKKKKNGVIRKLENEKFDDLRSFSYSDTIALVTLEAGVYQSERELKETIRTLQTIWNQKGNGSLAVPVTKENKLR